MKAVFAGYSTQELEKFTGFSVRNYYRNNHTKGITRCLLCRININENEVFEHTRSMSHDYNRLFQHFVRKRHLNGDMDFIFVNAMWVQCRYCNNVRFSRGFPHLQVEHNQSAMHLERKKYCLNRITSGPNKFDIPHNSRSRPKPCEITVAECYERERSRVGPSRPSEERKRIVHHQIQDINNLKGHQRVRNVPSTSIVTEAESTEGESHFGARHESVEGSKRKFFGFLSKKRNSKSGNPRESKLKLKKICTIC